jgi:hypothetical protein
MEPKSLLIMRRKDYGGSWLVGSEEQRKKFLVKRIEGKLKWKYGEPFLDRKEYALLCKLIYHLDKFWEKFGRDISLKRSEDYFFRYSITAEDKGILLPMVELRRNGDIFEKTYPFLEDPEEFCFMRELSTSVTV